MTLVEIPENPGKGEGGPPEGELFSNLLDWHLRWGTRPRGTPSVRGREWSNVEYGDALGVNERSVRNWRSGRSRPNLFLEQALDALFGTNPHFASWREALRAAFHNDVRRTSNSMPLPPTHFVGRDLDLEGLVACLRGSTGSCRLLIEGPPGVGKTALTAALASHAEVITRVGENRRWFVRAETITSNRALQLEIARTLGVGSAQAFPGSLAKLSEAPALLVIDNLETPWEDTSERRAVERTLSELGALPSIVLAASFRGADRVGGARWDAVLALAPLSDPDSSELFRRIAPNVSEKDPHLGEFVKALGGIPLAIELIASRAWAADDLGDLWAEWCKVGTRLAARPDFRRTRLTSLDRSIEVSLRSRRIDPAALRLLAYLGQLPAGIASADRDKLMGDEGFGAAERLCRVGLAFRRGPRLHVLAPIREFAARHHPPSKKAALRWPRHYLDLTRNLGDQIGKASDTGIYTRLKAELPNIQAAFGNYLIRKSLGKPLGALGGLFRIATMSGTELPVVSDIASACVDKQKASWQGTCMNTVACIAHSRGDDEVAQSAYEASLQLYELGGYDKGIAAAYEGLAAIAFHRRDIAESEAFYRKALAITEAQKPEGDDYCFLGLGYIKMFRSDLQGARSEFERARRLTVHEHHRLGESHALRALARVDIRKHDHPAAREKLNRSKSLCSGIGYARAVADCELELAYLESECRREEVARAHAERALAGFREDEDLSGEASCYKYFAMLAEGRSSELSEQHLTTALDLYRHAGDVRGEANCQLDLARLAQTGGDFPKARDFYRDALTMSRRLKRRQEEAEVCAELGAVLVALDQSAEARGLFNEARVIAAATGDNRISRWANDWLATLDEAKSDGQHPDVLH